MEGQESQTGRRGEVAAAGSSIVAPEAAGGVVESQATILDRAERACVSLDAGDRAGMAIRSSRRVTKRTTDQTFGVACCSDRNGVTGATGACTEPGPVGVPFVRRWKPGD